VGIVEEFVEIWPNEVCDTEALLQEQEEKELLEHQA